MFTPGGSSLLYMPGNVPRAMIPSIRSTQWALSVMNPLAASFDKTDVSAQGCPQRRLLRPVNVAAQPTQRRHRRDTSLSLLTPMPGRTSRMIAGASQSISVKSPLCMANSTAAGRTWMAFGLVLGRALG